MVVQRTLNPFILVRIQVRQQGTSRYLAPQGASNEWDRSRVPHGTRANSVKFYYAYVLHNSSKNYIYIGYSEDLKQRIISHNKGENTSTKPFIPLELIHYEAYIKIKDAKRREKYLKSNKGRTTLMTMLKEYFSELKK